MSDSSLVTINASDGVRLAARVYETSRRPLYDCLILPGIGVPQRAFRHVASFLADNAVRVATVDYRGVGESRGDPAALASATLTAWGRFDAPAALRFAESLSGGGKVVLLAHSFGGQTLGFSSEFRRLAGAILVASQFGQARHWDGLERLKVAAYWRFILPLSAAVFEIVPGWTGIGEPLPRGVAREWARWGRTRDWLLSHVDGAAARYAEFDRPIRAYAALDDAIAPPRAVSDLLSRFRSAAVERIDLRPEDLGVRRLGHLGLFRPGPTERIWREFLECGSRFAGARQS